MSSGKSFWRWVEHISGQRRVARLGPGGGQDPPPYSGGLGGVAADSIQRSKLPHWAGWSITWDKGNIFPYPAENLQLSPNLLRIQCRSHGRLSRLRIECDSITSQTVVSPSSGQCRTIFFPPPFLVLICKSGYLVPLLSSSSFPISLSFRLF